MEVSGGIALLILILQLDVVICQRHASAALPPRNTRLHLLYMRLGGRQIRSGRFSNR